MDKSALLVTTDAGSAPAASARQEFICRVHLLRVLYRHAEGVDSEALGERIVELSQRYDSNPANFVQDVLRQASALRWLRGCTREVHISDLRPVAFPAVLRDLANAKKHGFSLSPGREKLFFDYEFPEVGFTDGCWDTFRPAVIEWMKASRLDSLWPARAVKQDGKLWFMKVDRGHPMQFRVDPGTIPIDPNKEYVVREKDEHYSVCFPFFPNLSLPEVPCPQ
jgi:hypothetical protein